MFLLGSTCHDKVHSINVLLIDGRSENAHKIKCLHLNGEVKKTKTKSFTFMYIDFARLVQQTLSKLAQCELEVSCPLSSSAIVQKYRIR
jgi:hypothetical protein